MKRPYRQGDLFAVLLSDGVVARGVVVEMAGRFPLLAFLDAGGAPVFVARVDDRALVVLRWPIVGRDASFNLGSATPSSDRIEAPEIVERRLQATYAGTTWHRPRVVVRDLRVPFAGDAFAGLPADAWIAWREVLGDRDRERAAEWLAAHPRAGLRLHGRAAALDAGVVRRFSSLQRAAIQACGDTIAAFESSKHLRELGLEGVPGDLSGIGSTPIQRVRIVGRSDETIDAADFLFAAERLTSIACAGTRIENAEAFAAMAALRALRLTRTSGIRELGWLSRSGITHLTLDGLTHVDDLRPLATMKNLEHLTVRGMWQFGVDRYGWIDGCARLRGLSIDAGGRRKTVEIYRRRPFAAALPFP